MFNKEKNNNYRFKVIYKQGKLSYDQIILDIETGVNYQFTGEGYVGGFTVLLDKEGKSVITTVES